MSDDRPPRRDGVPSWIRDGEVDFDAVTEENRDAVDAYLDEQFRLEDENAPALTPEEESEERADVEALTAWAQRLMAMTPAELAVERRERLERLRARENALPPQAIVLLVVRLGLEFDEVETLMDRDRASRMLAMRAREEHPISELGDEMSADLYVLNRAGLLRRLSWDREDPEYEVPPAEEVATWSDDFLRAYLTRQARLHGVTVDGKPPAPDAAERRSRRGS